MSLAQHLLELRRRLFWSAAALLGGAVGGWFLAPFVMDVLRAPVLEIAGTGREATLNFANVSSSFDLTLRVAVTVGVIVASPVWLYQIWAFVVPALERREKAYAVGFVGAALPLFVAGCWCGTYVLPSIVGVLTGFVAPEDSSIIDATTYYDFVMKRMLAIGVAFVLPVFLVLLDFVGVVTARTIIGGWRVAVISIVLFTAVATPAADVFSMFLLAVPMVVLYLLAAGVAGIHDWRAARRAAREGLS